MTPAVWLRRIVWVVFGLLLVSSAEAASLALTADFDGDGHSDTVAIDHVDPSILHVRLSRAGTVTQIRRDRPVLQIAAQDLDGDHLPELITTEDISASAWTRRHTLRVWKPDVRRGFRTIHPRRRGPGTVKAPPDKALHEDDPADDATEDLTSSLPSRDSVTTRDPVAAEPSSTSILPAPGPDAAPVSAPSLDPSTPRAPPA